MGQTVKYMQKIYRPEILVNEEVKIKIHKSFKLAPKPQKNRLCFGEYNSVTRAMNPTLCEAYNVQFVLTV